MIPILCVSLAGLGTEKTKRSIVDFSLGKQEGPSQTRHSYATVQHGWAPDCAHREKSQAINMSWIAKLFDENCPGKFSYTMIEILNQYKQANLGKNVFKIFLSFRAAAQLPTYYYKMSTAWGNFAQDRRCKPSNIQQILTEPLFDNQFITIGHNIGEKQLIFYPNWWKSNVMQIETLHMASF